MEVYQGILSKRKRKCPICGLKTLVRCFGIPQIITEGTSLKDSKGTPIWFPKDGSPYYDRALNKVFKSAKEKQTFMNQNKLIMDGSSDKRNRPIESGDHRYDKVRKNKMVTGDVK